ncbi:protein FAM47A-like [Myotis daubentonii]|uniref:protein FAM47A-like n=1 Tax=Myotis daubentonii TaxID=98922 RepID=UPI002873CBF3|nr:protein FAM47A-like [Myotis daubentonii]
MACQQWPLPEPHKGWLLKSDLRKKALIESGLIKPWQSGPKLAKKPEPSKKWLLGPGPQEPLPLGMNCKPWFKDRDRLPSRYLCRQNKQLGKCPTSMDSRRWVFVKEGLDDFRTGCPSAEDVITRGPWEGFLPMIAHRIPRPPPKKIHRQPPMGANLCSKLSPAQRARKAFVENIEASLTQQSLANCPNLEEALPPDLLLKVLEVLDPDRKLEDTWAYCKGTKERKKTPTHLCEEHPEETNLEPPQAANLEPPEEVHLESFRKLNLELPEEGNLEPEYQAYVQTAKESLQSYLFSLFPEEEKNAACTTDIPKDPGLQKSRRRIREFCRWIDDNFGDIGIDEADLMKQFEIDLEVPLTHNTVKIKKIGQLPLNIRPCKQLDDIQQRKFSLQEGDWERKVRKQQDPYKPKREKIRYGAWYLDPKSWKKLVNGQPLPDPKVVPDKEHLTDGRHLEPDIIDELYGPIAFKDFIVSKGYRMPDVIEKMFKRKGWNYESVKTPIHRVMKLLSKPKEEDSGDKED